MNIGSSSPSVTEQNQLAICPSMDSVGSIPSEEEVREYNIKVFTPLLGGEEKN